MGIDGSAYQLTERIEKGTFVAREAETRAALYCEDAERRWLLLGGNEDMDPIDGSLRAENIQRSRGVGDLNKLNASVGRVDPRLGICAFRPVGRWSVPIGQLRADNDNPAVRRELQNVAMLDVESADYERRDRRQLRINAGCDRSLQQLGRFSAALQSSFFPLRFAVAVALEPARAGQRCQAGSVGGVAGAPVPVGESAPTRISMSHPILTLNAGSIYSSLNGRSTIVVSEAGGAGPAVFPSTADGNIQACPPFGVLSFGKVPFPQEQCS